MAATVTSHLTRLLGLIPYAYEHPDATLAQTAKDFGITEAELKDDLMLLWVVGRPGHFPDDLIDVSFEDGYLSIANADEISFPVRLTPNEARTLLVTVQYLQNFSDVERGAAGSLMDKLAAFANESQTAATLDFDGVPPALREQVTQARSTGQGLAFDYYVAARDEMTRRLVTPLDFRLRGQWVLEAYCHTAGGYRQFATAHIRDARTADVPPIPERAGTPDQARAPGGALSPVAADPTLVRVRLALAAEAAWLADELPAADLVRDTFGPGTVEFTLPVFSREWLTRFVLSHGRHLLFFDQPELLAAAIAELAAGCG